MGLISVCVCGGGGGGMGWGGGGSGGVCLIGVVSQDTSTENLLTFDNKCL